MVASPKQAPGAGQAVGANTSAVQGPVSAALPPPPGPAIYAYDAAGRLGGVTHPSGDTARYRYDLAGNLLGVDRFPSSSLSVLSVVPASARPGATITVHGTGFSTVASANQVTFNGTAGTVTAATATSLKVEIPATVSSGAVSVQVGGTTVTGETFTVAAAPPVVTAASPTSGPPSTAVTLTGSGFDPAVANNVVDVNGVLAEVTAVTATSLQFVVPVGATTGDVTISTSAGSTQVPGEFSVPYPGVDPALIESVTPMTVGGAAQTISVGTAGKAALVVFRGPAGGRAGIGLTASTFSTSIKARVVGPRGRAVGELSGVPAMDLELTRLDAGATYQLLLDPDGAANTGQVRVTLSAPVTGELAVNGTPTVAAMAVSGQDALLTFTGAEGDSISLGFTANTLTSYAYLDIVAPDLTVLVDHWQLTTGGVGDIDLPPLTMSGTYQLRLDPNQAATGNVTVTLSTPQTGVLISGGAATQVSLTRPGQNALVTFTGVEGEMAHIGLTASTLTQDTKFVVTDPSGNTLVDWTLLKIYTVSDIDITRLPATGTYTVRLDPSAAGTGGIRLTLSPPATAGPLTVTGPSLTASITRPGQDAVLVFTGDADAQVNIGLSTTLTKNAYIDVIKPDGSLLLNHRLLVASDKGNIDLRLPAAGTYRVRLDIVDAGIGNVTATLSTPVAAGELTPTGVARTVTISRLGQNAILTFAGTAGQAVNFGFTSNTISKQTFVDLIAPDGTVVVNDRSIAALSNGDLDVVSIPASGTYQIVLDPAFGATGGVTVTGSLSVLPGDLAVDGAGLSATLGRPGQDALYTFTGTVGQLLRLNVSGVASFGGNALFVTVIKPDGAELSAFTTLTADGPVTVPALPVAGSYKVVVDIGNAATGTATVALATRPALGAMPAARRGADGNAATGRATSPSPPPSPSPSPSAFTQSIAPPGETLAGEVQAKGPSWKPDGANLTGFDWNIRRGWAEPPRALTAMPGQTTLSGHVRTVDGRALPRAAVQLGEVRGRTDAQGRFLLIGVPAGTHTLIVDGGPAGHRGVRYGLFEIKVEVTAGQTSVLPYTVWMQQLDTQHMVRFASPSTTETVLRTPKIPGLEVRIPAGSVIRDRNGKVVTELGITPIPIDRPPFPLPKNGVVPTYFTVQPGGTYIFPEGAQIIYPNYTKLPSGTRVNFWNYDPEKRGWHVYGHGQVSLDARQVVPDRDTKVWAFHGAMFNTDFIPPWLEKWFKDFTDWLSGDPVELSTGKLSDSHTDLAVDDVMPIDLTRNLWQGDDKPREFGIGQTSKYGMILHSEKQYEEVDLYIPGGGKVHYIRTSPGVGFTDAVFETRQTAGEFTGSKVWFHGTWGTDGDWRLTLRNGLEYVFPQYSRLEAIRDRHGNEIRLTRAGGPTDDLTQITSPNGKWIKLSYDAQHRVTQAQDNIGRTVRYTYNAANRLETVTDSAGKVSRYTYDSAGRLFTAIDARGVTYMTNEYDAAGRVTKQTLTGGQVYQFAYTVTAGRVTETRVTTPSGAVHQVIFDANGIGLTETVAYGTPLARTTTYERGANGRIEALVDPGGRRTAYHYDTKGRLTHLTALAGTVRAVDGPVVTYGGPHNQPIKVTDQFGKVSRFVYNADGDIASVADRMNRITHYGYNTDGQVISLTDPTGKVTRIDYAFGQPSKITDPLGNVTRYFSDAVGRTVTVVNSQGASSKLTYDALNQVTQATNPLGHTFAFAYDNSGNLRGLTDPRGNTVGWDYDDSDRVIRAVDALGRASTTGYDVAGRSITTTSRTGKTTVAEFDILGRQTKVSYGVTGQTAESAVTFAYDNLARLAQISDTAAAGPVSFSHDDLDRITRITQPAGIVDYTYDLAGRRRTMTLAGQSAVTYTRDDIGAVTGIAQGGQVVAVTRDAAGRTTKVGLPGDWSRHYSHDGGGRVTGLVYKHGGVDKGALQYDYDSGGHTTAVTGSLAKIALPDTVTGMVYDNANRLTNRNGQAYTYDAEGNLIADGGVSYTWDARNQLVKLERPGLTATFGYGALGDREKRTVNGVTRGFVSDGPNPVAETDGSLTTATLLSADTDQWLTRTTATGTQTFLTDLQGSTLALGDQTGQMTASYAYDPYGNPTVSGDPAGNSLTYTGREDDGTGLMYYRARYYSPTLQRFISEDPIGLTGGANLYTYAGNAPTDYTDPSGNNPVLVGCVVGGLTDGAISYLGQRLSGRKVDWGMGGVGGAALEGCALGGLFGFLGRLGKFGGCLGNSFTAGTLVLMADGTRKPIKDIKVGDRVLAGVPETGHVEAKPVTALITGEGDKHLVEITVDVDGARGDVIGTITATEAHPFWVPDRKEWVDAGRLQRGMWLRTSAGTHVQVSATRKWAASQRVHNLTVDDLHTYYVAAGVASVLVHNCKGPVYRVIRPDEDPSVGLMPKKPSANVSVDEHVRYGSRPGFESQYISTTKNLDIARAWAARTGNRIVSINLGRVRAEIIDLSTYQDRAYHLLDAKGRGYAMRSEEVLINGGIPADALDLIP
ncbi:RHS repeat-associated core domain-containing protein [Streptosporangium sp. NPDC004631]